MYTYDHNKGQKLEEHAQEISQKVRKVKRFFQNPKLIFLKQSIYIYLQYKPNIVHSMYSRIVYMLCIV